MWRFVIIAKILALFAVGVYVSVQCGDWLTGFQFMVFPVSMFWLFIWADKRGLTK